MISRRVLLRDLPWLLPEIAVDFSDDLLGGGGEGGDTFTDREKAKGSGKVDRKLFQPMLAGKVRWYWERQGQTCSERK